MRIFRIFRTISIQKKLTISLVLMVAMILGTTAYAYFSFNRLSDMYTYNIDNIFYRTQRLWQFHQEFTEFRLFLALMHVSEDGNYGYDAMDWDYYLNIISNSNATLNELATSYIVSTENDPIFSPEDILVRVYTMSNILEQVNAIYSSFQGDLYHATNVAAAYVLQYVVGINYSLYFLLGLADHAGVETIWMVDMETANFAIILTMGIVVLPLGVALIGYVATKSISRGVKFYRDNVIGHINNIISGDTESQNFQMNPVMFDNSYKDTVDAINSLLASALAGSQQNDMMQVIFDNLPVAVAVYNRDKDMLDCNQEAVRMFGLSSKEEYQENVLKTAPEYQADGISTIHKIDQMFEEVFRNGRAKAEVLRSHIDGGIIPCEATYLRAMFRGEQVIISYTTDLRDLKESMAREKAAIENTATKSRFLAKMSHEIRTPIAAVLGISEIQLRNKMSPEMEEAFVKIYNSANVLLGIVNDILDLSKIEAGKLTIVDQEYEVASFLVDCLQMNSVYHLADKQIDFKVTISEDMPSILIGDELRLRQVFNNILSNAFKYTDQGSVHFSMGLEDIDEDNIALIFGIRDTGKGMTREQIDTIFEEYSRFNESKFVQGTGLGMNITHSLIRMMNGSITIESEAGAGTTVCMKIPQKKTYANTMGIDTIKNLEHFRSSSLTKKLNFAAESMPYGKVLVVDDVETNIYVIRGLLGYYGLQIDTCNNGKDAIEKIEAGEEFDMILMDQMMPELSGVETTDIIRKMGYKLPIIAFTANALVGQAEEYLQKGFDGFISKPIQLHQLDDLLHKFVKRDEPIEAENKSMEELLDGMDWFEDDEEEYDELAYLREPEIRNQIIKEFLETQSNAYQDITNEIEANDIKAAHLRAHTLKGLASMLFENELFVICEKIEKNLKIDILPTSEELNRMNDELERTLEKIKD